MQVYTYGVPAMKILGKVFHGLPIAESWQPQDLSMAAMVRATFELQ
jgi:hypothetical protein